MDVLSKQLMEFYSNIVTQNGGKVLDVGFGLGYRPIQSITRLVIIIV